MGAPPFSAGSLAETNSSADDGQSRFTPESRSASGCGSETPRFDRISLPYADARIGRTNIPDWNVGSAVGPGSIRPHSCQECRLWSCSPAGRIKGTAGLSRETSARTACWWTIRRGDLPAYLWCRSEKGRCRRSSWGSAAVFLAGAFQAQRAASASKTDLIRSRLTA